MQRVVRWVVEHRPGGLSRDIAEGRGSLDTESLRTELASLRGIGPATADALLLRAFSRPVFPVDQATYRILVRHGWLDSWATYEEARAVVEGQCTHDAVLLARMSEWLARVGSEFCRVREPKCEACPLRCFLPRGGPFEPEITSV
jgi:endonuclease-3 related protein